MIVVSLMFSKQWMSVLIVVGCYTQPPRERRVQKGLKYKQFGDHNSVSSKMHSLLHTHSITSFE